MKKLLTFFTAVFVGPALAQSDPSHMVELSAENLLQATLSFDKSKSRGLSSDNDTQLDLNLNYAYALPMHRRLQLGSKLTYNKGTEAPIGDFENYGLDVGAYYNFSGWNRTDPVDLMNSAYLSAFVGLTWANRYSGDTDRKDEVMSAALALGKRWDFKRWNVGHVTYNPELALTSQNSTTGATIEYTQAVEFRLLQFAMFW